MLICEMPLQVPEGEVLTRALGAGVDVAAGPVSLWFIQLGIEGVS